MPAKNNMHKIKLYKIIIAGLTLFAAGLISFTAMAGEPEWQNVPEIIRTRPGTAQNGNFLFATAAAGAENIRADKAHEIARKKSFLRALQMIRIASSCKDLIAGLKPDEQYKFIQIFAPFAADAHIKGITVIRQWEKERIHYTTVAVPIAEVNNIKCKFPDLSSAISSYIEIDNPSISGLAFCLRHAPGNSSLNNKIKNRITKWFQGNDQKEFALCTTEKGLQDGGCFKNALARKTAYLKALNSPEAEVYQYLLSQHTSPSDAEYYSWSEIWPLAWKNEMERLKDNPVANLIVASYGHALTGTPAPPAPEYIQAVTLFNQAKTDEEIGSVIELLFLACEKQPLSPETYNLIGACYRHLGKYEIALPFLWQALTFKPEYDLALVNLGLCCEKLGLMRAAGYYFGQEAVKNSGNGWVLGCFKKFNHESTKVRKHEKGQGKSGKD